MKQLLTFKKTTALVATLAGFTLASPSVAQQASGGLYFSGSFGLASLMKSNNAGALTSDFTTGAGTTIPAGTVLPSGTDLAWDTDFKSGYNFALGMGYDYGNGFRTEFEVRYIDSDVDSHDGVLVGGGAIGTEDAGVLITGSPNLGADVATIVADGQGSVSTLAFMGNTYYDFMAGEAFSPYLGAGIGYSSNSVKFSPSAVGVADDKDGALAFQLIAGADFDLNDQTTLFADYRYFMSQKVKTQLDLLPGELKVENKASLFNIGVRYRF